MMPTQSDLLNAIVVMPLVYLVGFVFAVLFRIVGNAGLAIVLSALLFGLACLPLYRAIDDARRRERDLEQGMRPWVSYIKERAEGDERNILLETYYRQRGFTYLRVLLPSATLALQAPLFIAAFLYFSDLTLLEGIPFMGIADLSLPQGALAVVAAALYVAQALLSFEEQSRSEIVQPCVLGVALAALLFACDAGVVLFALCSELFLLGKVLVERALVRSGRVHKDEGVGARAADGEVEDDVAQDVRPTFLLACALCVAVLGVLVPSALVSASPAEFTDVSGTTSPLDYVLFTACVFAGAAFVWAGGYFHLLKGAARERMTQCAAFLGVSSLVDYLFFGQHLGTINTSLVFSTTPTFEIPEMALNLVVLVVLAVVLVFVWRNARNFVSAFIALLIVCVVVLDITNINTITSALSKRAETVAATEEAASSEQEEESASARVSKELFDEEGNIKPLFTLSKEGRNVVVLFLDRAIGGYVPYMFQEKPELAAQFDGFIYYPNSVSYGMWTMIGAPALAGGYEYTPPKLNERSDELLMDKHDEALKVLPQIFSSQGFSTTLINPPLVHYNFSATDFSTFSEIENLKAYRVSGAYVDDVDDGFADLLTKNRYRNFVFYSLFKGAPVVCQPALYDEGSYFTTIVNHAANAKFLAEYATLARLQELTSIEEGSSDNYLFMQNEAPHEGELLQMPDYVSSPFVDNRAYLDLDSYVVDGRKLDLTKGISYYCSNMAAFKEIGAWFDYLREQGVYDNTRIIMVSDHGYKLEQFEDLLLSDYVDIEAVDCLLMVKDFGAEGPMQTSREFMTNADTPSLALAGIVDNPKNPYTGNPISMQPKAEGDQTIYFTVVWNSNKHRKDTQFDFGDGFLYGVHDDIFTLDNWTQLSEPTTSEDWR